MEWIDSKEKYQGSWNDDVPSGIGNLIWLEDMNSIRLLKNRYSGEFQNGAREGLGVFYYSDGSMYEGQWKNNKKEGYAVFTDEKGVSVYGYYEDDRLKRQLFLFDLIYDQMGMGLKYGDSNQFSFNNYDYHKKKKRDTKGLDFRKMDHAGESKEHTKTNNNSERSN